jgi:hypothetical protein
MSAHADFVPGLHLGRLFFEEAGRLIIESIVPRHAYAAALIGKGSDVLGFDTERSMDHDWGPRFQVFLAAEDFEDTARHLDEELTRSLPSEFKGFDVGVHESGESAETPARPHRVEITTAAEFLRLYLAVNAIDHLTALDWLTFPEQRLLELTSGAVFHDPRGELAAIRKTLAAYPRDVWLYRMACQWQRLAQHEGFAGRCAEAGDTPGMKLVAARIIRDLMKLCFLMERRFAPYDKWLGTSFAQLACAPKMLPLLAAALDAPDYQSLEPILAGLYRCAGEIHNTLRVTGPMDVSPRAYFSRPYTVMRADRFANALLSAVQCEELRRIPVRMGAIDQFVDNTDFIEHPETYRRVLELYG